MLAIREIDEMKRVRDWSGKTVLVIGIARQGIALARYLTQHGAKVIANDRRDIDQLRVEHRKNCEMYQFNGALGVTHYPSWMESIWCAFLAVYREIYRL